MKSSAVEKRECVGQSVEIHLTADIIHAQVKFLPADLGRLLVEIQTSLLVQANHLQQLPRIILHLLSDGYFLETDVALE